MRAHSSPPGPAPTIATRPPAGSAAPAHDERRGGPAVRAGRPELRVDGAQEDGVEGAAVLVAGHARPDLRRAAAEQLARHVGVGDQRARHADQVGAGGQRGLDRVRRAEGLRDEQRPVDQRPEPLDVAEQRRLLGGHVAHVRRAHADGQVHVVRERAHMREQLAQPVDGQAGLVPAVDREPDAEDDSRCRGRISRAMRASSASRPSSDEPPGRWFVAADRNWASR